MERLGVHPSSVSWHHLIHFEPTEVSELRLAIGLRFGYYREPCLDVILGTLVSNFIDVELAIVIGYNRPKDSKPDNDVFTNFMIFPAITVMASAFTHFGKVVDTSKERLALLKGLRPCSILHFSKFKI